MSAVGKRNTSYRASKHAHGWEGPFVIGAAREDFRGWSSQGQVRTVTAMKEAVPMALKKSCEAECTGGWCWGGPRAVMQGLECTKPRQTTP